MKTSENTIAKISERIGRTSLTETQIQLVKDIVNFNIIGRVYNNCSQERLAANRDGFYYRLDFPRNLFDNTTEKFEVPGILFIRHDNLFINETFCRNIDGFNAYRGLQAMFNWALY